MQPLSTIDPLAPGRPSLSQRDRDCCHQQRQQQAREAGYRQLTELCRLGEPAAAARLARRHANWGWVVVAGEVCALSEALD